MPAAALILLHLGPHNLLEWIIYGAVLFALVGFGVLAMKGSRSGDGLDDLADWEVDQPVKPRRKQH